MSTLNQESKVENITLTGVIDGADVRLTYSRENDSQIRQIDVHASKPDVNAGGQMNVFINWQPVSRSVNINMLNCRLDNALVALVESLLAEMQAVNAEPEVQELNNS